jgi:multiple antibiotic resistance protein
MLGLWEGFLLLLVIMDPVVSVSALLSLSKDKDTMKRQIIKKAMIVAAFIFFLFAIGGEAILGLLGVSIDSFRAAGGVMLIIMGIQLALGVSFIKKEDISEVAVIIGTPLISGPAVIMTTMILVGEIGLFTTLIAGTGALVVTLASLLLATQISRILGKGGLKTLSTMMGIVTIAWGIQFLLTGIIGFF